MRNSREQAAATRDRIVDTASRLYRERGINGIGVSDLMREAGLTHGGLYKHFESKDALIAEACSSALTQLRTGLVHKVAGARDEDALAVLVNAYLTPAHRDHPGHGCAIAALGSEASRGDGPGKTALAEGVTLLLDLIGEQLARGGAEEPDRTAHGVLAALVGGLLLSRAVEDPARSRAILRDTRDFILRGEKS